MADGGCCDLFGRGRGVAVALGTGSEVLRRIAMPMQDRRQQRPLAGFNMLTLMVKYD